MCVCVRVRACLRACVLLILVSLRAAMILRVYFIESQLHHQFQSKQKQNIRKRKYFIYCQIISKTSEKDIGIS